MFTEEEEFIFLLLLLDFGLFYLLRARVGLEMDPSTTQPENEDLIKVFTLDYYDPLTCTMLISFFLTSFVE